MLLGLVLVLFLGYAFSWVFAFLGLTASSPEAANAYGFTILFPLTFVSSAFVPVASMPSWLQPFAENNPFTTMVNAARALFVGTGRQRRMACVRVGLWDHRPARGALDLALPPRRRTLARLLE